MLVLDPLDRAGDEHPVAGSNSAVAVRVHHHVGGVAVLMTAVTGGARDPRVVPRRPEPRVHTESEVDHADSAATALHFGDDQLQLVEQARIDCNVLRPDVFLRVVRDEVADRQVRADVQLLVVRPDFEEALGVIDARGVSPGEALRQIGADAVAVQHPTDLALEGHQHGDDRLGHHLALGSAPDRETIEAWAPRRDEVRATKRMRGIGRGRVAEPKPLVAKAPWIAANDDRKLEDVPRQREAHAHLSAPAERVTRRLGVSAATHRGSADEARLAGSEPAERTARRCARGTEELYDAKCRERHDNQARETLAAGEATPLPHAVG
jgi:hypothetical protein